MQTFTAKETTQLTTLVEQWASGRLLPLDCRTISAPVKRWALAMGLLAKRADSRCVCGAGYAFHPAYELPIDALWALVRPMLRGQRSRGKSLATDSRWLTLNVYPEGHRAYAQRDLDEQMAVLGRLANHGYLIVQMAGSVWEITDTHFIAQVS